MYSLQSLPTVHKRSVRSVNLNTFGINGVVAIILPSGSHDPDETSNGSGPGFKSQLVPLFVDSEVSGASQGGGGDRGGQEDALWRGVYNFLVHKGVLVAL